MITASYHAFVHAAVNTMCWRSQVLELSAHFRQASSARHSMTSVTHLIDSSHCLCWLAAQVRISGNRKMVLEAFGETHYVWSA